MEDASRKVRNHTTRSFMVSGGWDEFLITKGGSPVTN